jgi:hypothetical protein
MRKNKNENENEKEINEYTNKWECTYYTLGF